MTVRSMTVRPVVRKFAERMEKALAAHDGDRGRFGWREDNVVELLDRLDDELQELREAVAEGEPTHHVSKEAVDVANFAMMVADVYARQP